MRQLLIVMAVIMLGTAANAQKSKVSLNLLGGYTFQDRVNFDAAYTNVQDGFQYGGSLEFFPAKTSSVELSYQRMATNFPLYGPAGTQLNKGNDDGSVNYILLGGNGYMLKSNAAKAVPFFGGGLGVGILNGRGESATKFAWNIKGGVKIKTSGMVSIKLHAYLQSVISTFGNDYWYAGWGTVVAVPDYATLLQFGLGGAISLDFPKK
jgi:hypothetical protein